MFFYVISLIFWLEKFPKFLTTKHLTIKFFDNFFICFLQSVHFAVFFLTAKGCDFLLHLEHKINV